MNNQFQTLDQKQAESINGGIAPIVVFGVVFIGAMLISFIAE